MLYDLPGSLFIIQLNAYDPKVPIVAVFIGLQFNETAVNGLGLAQFVYRVEFVDFEFKISDFELLAGRGVERENEAEDDEACYSQERDGVFMISHAFSFIAIVSVLG